MTLKTQSQKDPILIEAEMLAEVLVQKLWQHYGLRSGPIACHPSAAQILCASAIHGALREGHRLGYMAAMESISQDQKPHK